MEKGARPVTAKVIQLFPQRNRSCWICKRGAWTEAGVYCTEFGEQIVNEAKAAEDCESYVEDQGKD